MPGGKPDRHHIMDRARPCLAVTCPQAGIRSVLGKHLLGNFGDVLGGEAELLHEQ